MSNEVIKFYKHKNIIDFKYEAVQLLPENIEEIREWLDPIHLHSYILGNDKKLNPIIDFYALKEVLEKQEKKILKFGRCYHRCFPEHYLVKDGNYNYSSYSVKFFSTNFEHFGYHQKTVVKEFKRRHKKYLATMIPFSRENDTDWKGQVERLFGQRVLNYTLSSCAPGNWVLQGENNNMVVYKDEFFNQMYEEY